MIYVLYLLEVVVCLFLILVVLPALYCLVYRHAERHVPVPAGQEPPSGAQE